MDFGPGRWVAYNNYYNDFWFCAICLPKPGICHGDNELGRAERRSRILGGLRGTLELGIAFGFEAGEALANVRDLHGVPDGGENLGVAASSRCLISLHSRLQRTEASLQLANLRGRSILQCLADILNHAHAQYSTLSAQRTVMSFASHL